MNHPGKVSGRDGKELDLPWRSLPLTFESSQFLELTKSGRRQGLVEGGRREQCEMWEQSFGGRRMRGRGCEAGSGRGKTGRGLEEDSGFATGICRYMISI